MRVIPHDGKLSPYPVKPLRVLLVVLPLVGQTEESFRCKVPLVALYLFSWERLLSIGMVRKRSSYKRVPVY
jgi:hypothetical protein